jgi:hypothetical protein
MSGATSKCNKEPTVGDVEDNLDQTLKAMGFDAECTKSARNAFATGSASLSASATLAELNTQASFTASANEMAENGCGQFSANLINVSTKLSNINCTIQDNQSTSSVTQTGTSTIRIVTQAPTGEQLKSLEQIAIRQQDSVDKLVQIAATVPEENREFFQKMLANAQATLQETLDKMTPDLTIIDSKVLNISNQTLKSEVTMTDDQVTQIQKDITDVATQAAEQKMRQDVGVNALSPNAKQLIQERIQKNTLLREDNIQSTIKSVSLVQGQGNTIEIINKGGGDLIIEGSTISNNIVQDLVNTAILNSGNSAASQVVAEIITEQASKQISEGKSAGQEDLARELGEVNRKAIGENKSDVGAGGVIAFGLLVLLLLGGGGFAIKKVKGAITKYIFLAIAVAGIIVGVVGKGKDPDNVLMIVIGAVLTVCGLGLGIYSLVRKTKLK